MSLLSDVAKGKPVTQDDVVHAAKTYATGGLSEVPDLVNGHKGKKSDYDYGLGAKNTSDAAAIKSIEEQKYIKSTETSQNAQAAMNTTDVAETKFRNQVTSDRGTLADQKKALDKERTKLADEKMKHTENISKWYEGIATSYEDIGKRYADAVTGLSNDEGTAMKGQNMQDFAAMSAITAQAYGTSTNGRAMTGNQSAVAAGMAQKQATNAYSASAQRMQDLDTQRRNQQMAIVTASGQQEMQNRTSGFQMQTGAVSMFDQLEGNNMQRSTGLQSMMTNMDQLSRGSSLNQANSDYGFQTDMSQASYDANTYGAEAGMRIRNNAFAQGLQADALNSQKDAANRQQSGAMMGSIGGIAGGAAGAYFGGPAGAAAGYSAGSGIGNGLGQS
jgi:hypothetical protein